MFPSRPPRTALSLSIAVHKFSIWIESVHSKSLRTCRIIVQLDITRVTLPFGFLHWTCLSPVHRTRHLMVLNRWTKSGLVQFLGQNVWVVSQVLMEHYFFSLVSWVICYTNTHPHVGFPCFIWTFHRHNGVYIVQTIFCIILHQPYTETSQNLYDFYRLVSSCFPHWVSSRILDIAIIVAIFCPHIVGFTRTTHRDTLKYYKTYCFTNVLM